MQAPSRDNAAMRSIQMIAANAGLTAQQDLGEARASLWPEMVYAPISILDLQGIAERLRSERARIGLGQKDLADAIGVTRMTMYRYEHGVQLPTISTLSATQELGFDVFFVLSGRARTADTESEDFFLKTEGLSDRLRIERERLGLRQIDLAAAARFTRLTQMGYEKGISFPPLEYFAVVQNRGVDLRFVFSGHRSAVLLGWQDTSRLEHALDAADVLLRGRGGASNAERAKALLKSLMSASATAS